MTVAEDLTKIACDVAVIKSRLEHFPTLIKRVEALEKSDTKRTAWAAGAGAIVTAILWLGSRLQLFSLLFLLAPLLCGCDSPPARWTHVPLLTFHPDVPVECVQSVLDGVEFWADLRVHAAAVPQEDAYFYEQGEIKVSADAPKDLDAGGNTKTRWNRRGEMLSAVITFRHCSDKVTRHELGHAFGLPDLYENEDIGNVMYWATSGMGTHVTEKQLAAIR